MPTVEDFTPTERGFHWLPGTPFRDLDTLPNLPIYFIGHSLGGLVVEQALLIRKIVAGKSASGLGDGSPLLTSL